MKIYDPAADSSPGYQSPGMQMLVIATPRPGDCLCGCAETPSSGRSHFLPGHDMKLRGKLLRAFLTRTPVYRIAPDRDYESTDPENAIDVAKQHGWDEYLLHSKDMRDNPPPRKSRAKPKAEPEPADDGARPQIGQEFPIKVGRWDYTGTIVKVEGDQITFEYESKTGEKRFHVSKWNA